AQPYEDGAHPAGPPAPCARAPAAHPRERRGAGGDQTGARGGGPRSGATEPVERRAAMDLGIRGRNAIVCASSRGLGKACAMSLAREGVNLTLMARTKDALEAAAKEIRDATGVRVTAVAGDVTTEAGRAALLIACPAPDILVNNAGGPPTGDFRDWDRDTWIRAVDANMITPIL